MWVAIASVSSSVSTSSLLQTFSSCLSSRFLVLRGGDGLIHHSVEVGVDSGSNQSPQLGVKATEKRILLHLFDIHLIRAIARHLRELVQVLHHCQVSLLEAHELLPLQLHHAVGDVVLMEQPDKVIPDQASGLTSL
jgi:hypothetical protein